jgi:hypothetical protein
MARLVLTPAQRSALECAGLEAPDGPKETALALAWKGGNALDYADADRDAIFEALTDLSNAEDAFAEDTSQDAEMRKHARRAARSLGAIASRVLRTEAR